MISAQETHMHNLLEWNLSKELKGFPKPWFVTNLFPESDLTVCRPLFPPFEIFAITHTGEIFCRRPLQTLRVSEDFVMIDPSMVLVPRVTPSGRSIVTLQNIREGYRKDFLVERLVMERFWEVKLTDKVHIRHLDDDLLNNHIFNLEADYV